MKYSLSIRQPNAYLLKADEIKARYNDIDLLFEYIEKYPDKQFSIILPYAEKVDWDLISQLNILAKDRIFVGLTNIKHGLDKCRELNLQYYWYYGVNNYSDLKNLRDIGVSYIHIAGALTHDLDTVRKCNIPLRMIPNIAYDNLIPHTNGITGQYVRPEDTDIYDKYITYFDFYNETIGQEQALFDIYKERRWNGNLNLLVKDLYTSADNRGFPEDFAISRINCKQICNIPGHSCRFCSSVFNLIASIQKSNQRKRNLSIEKQEEVAKNEAEFRQKTDKIIKEKLNSFINEKLFEVIQKNDQENDDDTESKNDN